MTAPVRPGHGYPPGIARYRPDLRGLAEVSDAVAALALKVAAELRQLHEHEAGRGTHIAEARVDRHPGHGQLHLLVHILGTGEPGIAANHHRPPQRHIAAELVESDGLRAFRNGEPEQDHRGSVEVIELPCDLRGCGGRIVDREVCATRVEDRYALRLQHLARI